MLQRFLWWKTPRGTKGTVFHVDDAFFVLELLLALIDLFVKWRPAGLTGQLFAAAARIPRVPI